MSLAKELGMIFRCANNDLNLKFNEAVNARLIVALSKGKQRGRKIIQKCLKKILR